MEARSSDDHRPLAAPYEKFIPIEMVNFGYEGRYKTKEMQRITDQ